MATFQQNVPSSLRFGPPHESRSASSADRRPYLITAPIRRNTTPARQTVSSTRQFLALFPHESEDARITGTTRSLYRRLLALNLPRPVARAETSSSQFESIETRFSVVGAKIA